MEVEVVEVEVELEMEVEVEVEVEVVVEVEVEMGLFAVLSGNFFIEKISSSSPAGLLEGNRACDNLLKERTFDTFSVISTNCLDSANRSSSWRHP